MISRSEMRGSLDRRMVLAVAVAIFSIGVLAVAEDNAPACNISFVVLKDANGKPIRNASVVMHAVNEKEKQARGGLQLKTDSDGKANFDGVPYGKLRVQVLAPGFQTFGEDYDINRPEMELTVKLKRPTGQYSIYEDHPSDKKPDTGDKPADPQPKP
jgi:hypothetical protein